MYKEIELVDPMFLQNSDRLVVKLIFALLLGLIPLCDNLNRCGAETDSWKKRFDNEAPKKWREYLKFAKSLQGTAIFKSRVNNFDVENSAEVRQNPIAALVLSQREHKKGEIFDDIQAFNSKYAFELHRKEDRERGWILSLILLRPTEILYERDGSVRRTAVATVAPHFCVAGETLPERMRDQNFTITDIRSVEDNGHELVHAAFAYAPDRERPSKLKTRIHRFYGSMSLDPGRYWCVKKIKLTHVYPKWQFTSVVSYEYSMDYAQKPIVKRSVAHITVDSPDLDVRLPKKSTSDYHFHSDPHVPEYKITLSAFGLPEPQGITWDRGPLWYLYFGIGAFLMLALAIGFRNLAKRRKKPTVESS